MQGEEIRVRGIVQGVGFRPTVWRLARANQLRGQVWNDAEGVVIQAWGTSSALDQFVHQLENAPPPLAKIVHIERKQLGDRMAPESFEIVSSQTGFVRTEVAADAATCPACLADVFDPHNRRYRYAFTNCTHCGPRLSIIRDIPYDRCHTSMADFTLCPACQAEYEDPSDRRFHAQPNACPECGPRVWLEDDRGTELDRADLDPIDHAALLIRQGSIVAIKGIGGIHLACDATNVSAVEALRERKRRYAKPFALMVRDPEMCSTYVSVNDADLALMQATAAPVVILDAHETNDIAAAVAPGQSTLGFMLPYTALHHLLMRSLTVPIVLTSGNHSDEPQCIRNDQARNKLKGIADYFLLHDREIVNRVDDSVVRMGIKTPCVIRRARGYAPGSIPLPPGFENAANILAMGAELKNTFCLLKNDRLIVSQHIGDLENADSLADYQHNLELYTQLFDHQPQIIAVDKHPNYFSTQLGHRLAGKNNITLVEIQHHHAHIAACMAEHQLPRNTKPVLGIALDGLGLGDDGALWGGEFLLSDYTTFQRIACFQPVPLIGGSRAMSEPWRNTYAHLNSYFGWDEVSDKYADLEIIKFISQKPVEILNKMIRSDLNSPLSSSCGRLFDAVAAALGIHAEAISYEGQAAIELESLARPVFLSERQNAYPVTLCEENDPLVISWTTLWCSLLDDLAEAIPRARIAARFHHGLIAALTSATTQLSEHHPFDTVVLSGGVFQNRLLQEGLAEQLSAANYRVLSSQQFPANDGGLSPGQAIIAAAMST